MESFASSPAVRDKMQRQRRRDTSIELALRSELFRRGLRYHVHRSPVPGLRREADIVFPRARVAVFVDSCWWHACPEHGTLPHSNRDWWKRKLEANQARDRDTTERFEADGWFVLRIWEHERVGDAADRVERAVAEKRGSTASGADRGATRRVHEPERAAPRSLPEGAGSPGRARR